MEKYKDSPCYNCLVRTTCDIHKEISIKRRFRKDINRKLIFVSFKVYTDTCRCIKLQKYLETKSNKEQLEFIGHVEFGNSRVYTDLLDKPKEDIICKTPV